VFSPDSKSLLAVGDGSWKIDVATGKQSRVGEPGTDCNAVSPDGREAACVEPGGRGVVCPIEAGACRPILGFVNGVDSVIQWSADSRSLYVGNRGSNLLRIDRLDLVTGKRELWREFQAPDGAASAAGLYYFTMTPDARYYAYSSYDTQSDLYLVTGLK
jgi:hypothetical protein